MTAFQESEVMEAAIEKFPLPNMGKSQYVTWVEKCGVGDLRPLTGSFECSVHRRGIVALGKSNLARIECSVTAGMVQMVCWEYLCDILVDDIGEHGVHGPEIM